MNNTKHWLRNWHRGALTLLALSGAAGTQAHALDMMIWNTGMETKLAYGESQGQVMRGQIVRGAAGSVVILFSRSEVERNRSLYSSLKSRYEGEIRGSEVMIRLPGGPESLQEFLAGYKLKLDLQETGAK